MLNVVRPERVPFSDAQLPLVQTFADQAVIVENARLLTELQARTAELQRSVGQLTAPGEVGQAVSSSLDLETVLTTIVSRAVELQPLAARNGNRLETACAPDTARPRHNHARRSSHEQGAWWQERGRCTAPSRGSEESDREP